MTVYSIDVANNILADETIIGEVPADAKELTVDIWQVPTDYRANGYFFSFARRDEPKQVPACKQSDVLHLDTLIAKPNQAAALEQAKKDWLNLANDDAEKLLMQLDKTYPEREVLTWDQQLREALEYSENEIAETPMLECLARVRGLELSDLANRVLAKSAVYKNMSGAIMGARQWVEDQIDAATDTETLFSLPSVADRIAEMDE